jgi:type IV pilus assembly protein PilM
LTSALATSGLTTPVHRTSLVGRIDGWLHAMPHPPLVVEIASSYVAAARWGAANSSLEALAEQPLPAGCVMPSPVEANITQPEVVRAALRRVLNEVARRGTPLALLVPDPAVRVFVLPFENLPRKSSDALPLLRWRLKKSVPFDVEETTVSWMRQSGRDGGLEIVAAIARQRILREYEQLVESMGARPGVLLSSTLAALPLLGDSGATLLARWCGATLTTVVVYGAALCVYRSTELAGAVKQFDPQAVLDEVFPAVAYFQDTWGREIDRAYLSGFDERGGQFRDALGRELRIEAESISAAAAVHGFDLRVKNMLYKGLDGLAGWAMNGGS